MLQAKYTLNRNIIEKIVSNMEKIANIVDKLNEATNIFERHYVLRVSSEKSK